MACYKKVNSEIFITLNCLLVKQEWCPTFKKLDDFWFDQFFDVVGSFATLHHLEDLQVYKKPAVFIDLPFVWVKFSQGGGDLEACSDRIERTAIGNDDIDPPTFLILEDRGVWLKANWYETNI
jgi:hypothetical protein